MQRVTIACIFCFINIVHKSNASINFCNSKYSSCPCDTLNINFLNCTYNTTCRYGSRTTGNCTVVDGVNCKGDRSFEVSAPCYYCYQLPQENYTCGERGYCQTASSSKKRLIVNCTVNIHQHCLGRRKFYKSFRCNWTSGKHWSTSLILSITAGGFGADRFYLGDWRKGLGKLFTFGGLGVWTLVDIILIGVGYITPSDGSLYVF